MGSADEKLSALFGIALKEYRNSIGVSQQEFALNCGLDRTFISLLERGLRQPTIKTIFTLSKHLGIKPSQIIGQVENRFSKSQ